MTGIGEVVGAPGGRERLAAAPHVQRGGCRPGLVSLHRQASRPAGRTSDLDPDGIGPFHESLVGEAAGPGMEPNECGAGEGAAAALGRRRLEKDDGVVVRGEAESRVHFLSGTASLVMASGDDASSVSDGAGAAVGPVGDEPIGP